MKTSDFDYNLPIELIAQKPIEPRDSSKMFVINKKRKKYYHKHFYDIEKYLKKGDLVIWNNSKVFKARLFGKLMSPLGDDLWEHKRDVEIFLVRPTKNKGVWQALAKPGKHVLPATKVVFNDDFHCEPIVKKKDGTLLVEFPYDEKEVREKANMHGHIPIPPYVKDEPHALEIYQTVYAKQEGSVAAPTAGFHFTKNAIKKLKNKGVEFEEVTLHVGLGTFLPVKTETVDDHTMHSEWVEISERTAKKINIAKKEGRRIVAVGTTSMRTLEGVANLFKEDNGSETLIHSYEGDIDIFIKPGFEFQVVDAMITNFHLPKSTLLMLVSAFVGDTQFTLDCYQEAVKKKYRFYSFGDAMFIE